MYEYDKNSANEAVLFANKAEGYVESIPQDMSSAAALASSVQVEGLDFLGDSSYSDTIDIISNYSSIIIGMISTAERDIIIECLENGDYARLVQYVNDGKISTQTLIEYSKEYMVNIMNSGNINTYNKTFDVIGNRSQGGKYGTVNEALSALGFSDEFIENLSSEYCKNLINNDLMYTKEGSVTMAVSFTGLLSMFNLKLGYEHTEYDRSYFGFYLGDGEGETLGPIDCTNYTDWLARCVGIDIYGYNQNGKEKYLRDGYTPEGEIDANYSDEFYKKAEGGDYLMNDEHMMMIVSNDGKGYYFAENGNFAEINYMTYEELNNQSYKVSNTDSLYRNTAPLHVEGEYIWIDDNGNLSSTKEAGTKTNKEQVFADPYWFINQKNINLTEVEQKN